MILYFRKNSSDRGDWLIHGEKAKAMIERNKKFTTWYNSPVMTSLWI